jgi:hypothetical protein
MEKNILEKSSGFVGQTSQPQSSLLLNSVSNSVSNSFLVANSIENLFGIITPDKYFQVVSKDITSSLKYTKKLTIKSFSTCNMISLIDFPQAPYILSLNSHNIMTSKNNTFDIGREKTPLAKEMVGSGLHYDCDEIFNSTSPPININECKYINFERYDSSVINYPSNVKLDKYQYKISLEGYYYENGVWIFKNQIMDLYPNNTYELDVCHITESIDFVFDSSVDNVWAGEQEVIFMINGYVYEKITESILKENNYKYRLKMNRTRKEFSASSLFDANFNDYIKENTINFSRMSGFQIILKNCKITNITQHYYMVYNYPSKTALYTA